MTALKDIKEHASITTQMIDLRGGARARNAFDEDGNQKIGNAKQLVLVIDVDNTLYSEKDLLATSSESDKSPWTCGIESQIVRNTHLFGLSHFNMTSDQCDDLYKKYGTTLEANVT